jgi:hypothetical protein
MPHAVPASTAWTQDLTLALTQVDSSLRLVIPEERRHPSDPIQSLSRHELDLDFGAVATTRRREHMAFLEGPPLFRHRLRLASRRDDLEDIADWGSLIRGSQTHPVMAAKSSAAADVLRGVANLRWLESRSPKEFPLPSLASIRWWMLAEHLWPSALQGGSHEPSSAMARRWRLQPHVWWNEPVHGAVSLAVPLATRRRIEQALWLLAEQGVLESLRNRHRLPG